MKMQMKKVILIAIMAVMSISFVACDDSYRVIKVYKLGGKTEVKSAYDDEKTDAYEGMLIESEDHVKVKDGDLVLVADSDKYLYAKKGTEFDIVAEGDDVSNQTRIDVKKGSVTSDIQKKLATGSSYEVNAPNCTMSVRGTIFTTGVKKNKKGEQKTYIEVFNGTVTVESKDKDENVLDSYTVEAGKGLSLYADENGTVTCDGVRDADIHNLTEDEIKYLKQLDEEYGEDSDLLVGDYDFDDYYDNYYDADDYDDDGFLDDDTDDADIDDVDVDDDDDTDSIDTDSDDADLNVDDSSDAGDDDIDTSDVDVDDSADDASNDVSDGVDDSFDDSGDSAGDDSYDDSGDVED